MSKPILINGKGSPQSIFESSTRQAHKVGTRAMLNDGRVFYYASNRIIAVITRHRLQCHSGLSVANHANQAQATSGTSVRVGMTRINVDVGASQVALGDYEEGFVFAVDGTGEGFYYKIRDHAGSAGSAPVALVLYDPIQVAWDATTDMSLLRNAWLDPGVTASQLIPVGVPLVSSPAATALATATTRATGVQHFWVQTWGPCGVLNAAATGAAVGAVVNSSPATAGALDGIVAGQAETDLVVGQALTAYAATEFHPTFLMIHP